jgi:hypothetical protein
MTTVDSIDSNSTGLRIAKWPLAGDSSDNWMELEPNSYKDFGAQIKTTPRNPINRNRQRRRGPPTDMDVSGGYQEDLTYFGCQRWFEGLICAEYIEKLSLDVATVDGTTNHDYEPASGGGGFAAGDIIFAEGFTQAANNGVKLVTGSPGATSVPSSGGGLVDETGATGTIAKIGYRFVSGDATIAASGSRWKMHTSTKDFTTLGLTVGEWVFMGGDAANTGWVTAGNCGWARIYSIAAHDLVLDKFFSVIPGTSLAIDAGTSKTVEIYFGRVLKNALGASITRQLYSIERNLGIPEDGGSDEQAEYLDKVRLDQGVITYNTADKITIDVDTMACNYDAVDAGDIRDGTRTTVIPGPAFNTSSNMFFCYLSEYDNGMGTDLLQDFVDASHTIKNNIKANKALKVFGAKSLSAGTFEVSATLTGYFVETAFNQAVRASGETSHGIGLIGENDGVNVGIVFDMPLITLSDGRLKVAQDEPITIPLTCDASTAIDVNPNSDYTFLCNFFDCLPDLATPPASQ